MMSSHRWVARLMSPALLFGYVPGLLVLVCYLIALATIGPRAV